MMQAGGYTIDLLVQGYPGRSHGHGGLGWSTVALLRGHGRVAVLDTGSFSVRKLMVERLAQFGLAAADVTDLLLSHLHYDHCVNWPMFPNARIAVGRRELDWALSEPDGHALLPELYTRPLAELSRVRRLDDGEAVLPGVTARLAPGHSPGHLVFEVEGTDGDVLLVQDAAKYLAELVSGQADMTDDAAVSSASIATIWSAWRRKPGTIVVPGHDLPLMLDARGTPVRLGVRETAISALFGTSLEDRTRFDLAEH